MKYCFDYVVLYEMVDGDSGNTNLGNGWSSMDHYGRNVFFIFVRFAALTFSNTQI